MNWRLIAPDIQSKAAGKFIPDWKECRAYCRSRRVAGTNAIGMVAALQGGAQGLSKDGQGMVLNPVRIVLS